MKKNAVITGIGGQDAAYMSRLLLERGYHVFGIGRTLTDEKLWRLAELGILNEVELVTGDITDAGFVFSTMKTFEPVEWYNFAAISFVGQSWKTPATTMEINAKGVVHILEGIRQMSPHTKLYQAGSSEMFGQPTVKIQDENVPFSPCNPYGVAKASAFHSVSIYRKAYGIFGCNAICYNHESPLRGTEYVTRKITDGVAKIKLGLAKEIRLGNIDSERDWGFAGDYVEAMWKMLQQEKSDDYVLSTGKMHSIKDFLRVAFSHAGIENWEPHVIQDEKFYRPLEPNVLCGNNGKAKKVLGWEPSLPFESIVSMMVDADLRRLEKSI